LEAERQCFESGSPDIESCEPRESSARVESNVSVPSITLGSPRLYFLPDLILYWEHETFGAISYDDLQIEQSSTRFIEHGLVPADSTEVGRTWRYVRRDGGPDRRFNNNV
jgi:hypothetical protein